MSKKAVINFKQGDDFKLDLTVSDTNSAAALAAKAILNDAETDYNMAIAADPQVPSDIVDTQNALTLATDAYNLSVIVDITGWTMQSQVRWSDKVFADLVITIADPTLGKFSISATPAVTALWFAREYSCDVEFNRPSGKVSSQTFIIDVEEDITQ